jgi:hypothetical protein
MAKLISSESALVELTYATDFLTNHLLLLVAQRGQTSGNFADLIDAQISSVKNAIAILNRG